ncbi:reverse transcriptase [Senna tora]|uniref:Reverse transcriptase n=1 Tax=Senna tora TaxID=362788 RepID=A0A834U2V7_9FABA|nr:reverse transcriptase [Senna tora]
MVNLAKRSARWNIFDVKRVEDWWCELLLGKDKVDSWIASLFAYTCWHIWKQRCNLVFENEEVDSSVVIQESFSTDAEHWTVNSFLKARCDVDRGSGVVNRWVPPSGDMLKINCDASFDGTLKSAGLGVIIIDDYGMILNGRCISTKACSVSVAEALTVKDALSMKGFELGLQCVGVMKDIFQMCGQLNWPLIVHIKRDANKATDWVARNAVLRMCPS